MQLHPKYPSTHRGQRLLIYRDRPDSEGSTGRPKLTLAGKDDVLEPETAKVFFLRGNRCPTRVRGALSQRAVHVFDALCEGESALLQWRFGKERVGTAQ
jgi:hypothetical protein